MSAVDRSRRYIPKGGHLVDFEKRVTPKLKRLLHDQRVTNAPMEIQPVPVAESEDRCKTLDARKPEDPRSECMAMVVWSGGCEGVPVGENVGIRSVTREIPATDGSRGEKNRAMVRCKKKECWKPPGCLKRSLWKRPVRGAHNADDSSKTGETLRCPKNDPMSEIRCSGCEKAWEERSQMDDMKQELEQQRQHLHLKRIRIEALESKFARERKEFENYKATQIEKIKAVEERMKHKQVRDSLAHASNVRGSGQQAELTKLRQNLQDYQLLIDEQKEKLKSEMQKHTTEIRGYKERQKRLEDDISVLQDTLANIHLGQKDCISSFDSPTDVPGTPDDTQRNDNRRFCAKGSKLTSQSQGATSVLKQIQHKNQTVETIWSNGMIQFNYINGDVRKSYQDSGVVDYFYCGIQCWNTTYPDGEYVFYFQDGRRECYCLDGKVQILLPDHQIVYSTSISEGDNIHCIPISAINTKILHPCPEESWSS